MTLTVEVTGRERERCVVPNTIASDLFGLVLTHYGRTRYEESRDKARVLQLEYRNYLWIWRHRAECRQRTATTGGRPYELTICAMGEMNREKA